MDEPDEALIELGPAEPLAIEYVHVAGLHGKFTYDIGLVDRENLADNDRWPLVAVNEQRLTLLYGNNGSGKTSLLRLIFHALSPARNKGHRTALYRTAFRSLKIGISNGTVVSYERDGPDDGPYLASISSPLWDEPVEWAFTGRSSSRLSPGASDRALRAHLEASAEQLLLFDASHESDPFVAALGELGINPVFLSDSRSIVGDALPEPSSLIRSHRDALARGEGGRRGLEVDELIAERRDLDVQEALERVRAYLAQIAYAGTQAGSHRADTVYLNVVEAIAGHAIREVAEANDQLRALREKVSGVEERAEPFHRYGLFPKFRAAPLLEKMESAAPENGDLLQQVLAPYLDSLDERMDALGPGLKAVASFVDAVNSFLERKHVEFRLAPGGVRIVDDDAGGLLPPSALSSGEKQIVLLFSDIVALQSEGRLFIIDEPEISLNPQWQRKLMPSLLRVTQQSSMQFIVATHSIEIMAQYRGRIRQLVDKG